MKKDLFVRLTNLGSTLILIFCLNNMRQIVDTAKRYNNFVRMDMEDLGHCQATLDLLHELRQMYDNVGTVIQAYLYRAEQDVKNLKGVSLRLVKGTYKEPPEVAFQDKQQVDENYMNIIRLHLLNGSYTAIATHETDMKQQLVKEGYTMRVYVPFGERLVRIFYEPACITPAKRRVRIKRLFFGNNFLYNCEHILV